MISSGNISYFCTQVSDRRTVTTLLLHISDSEFTVFAPTDAAFSEVLGNLLDFGNPDGDIFQRKKCENTLWRPYLSEISQITPWF